VIVTLCGTKAPKNQELRQGRGPWAPPFKRALNIQLFLRAYARFANVSHPGDRD